jgi:hypothetical protein
MGLVVFLLGAAMQAVDRSRVNMVRIIFPADFVKVVCKNANFIISIRLEPEPQEERSILMPEIA